MTTNYDELTQKQLTADAKAGPVVALLPVGAMENHGPHLPLGTDHLIADGLADRLTAACGGQVCKLPALWLGVSGEHVSDHADPQATLSIEAGTLIDSIEAIAAGLKRAGINRLLLLNGHGGNIAALSIAALNARRHHGMLVANAHWLDFGLPDEFDPPTDIRADVHGGWLETSLMMALRPELVTTPQIKANPAVGQGGLLFPSGPVQWGWKTDDLAAGGWVGRPDLASADTGNQLLSHSIEKLTALVAELSVRNL